MTRLPPATGAACAHGKINLFLDILGLRDDGYHDLESVMIRIAPHDTVQVAFAPGKGIAVHCSDPSLPVGEGNLVWKAADLFRRHVGAPDTGLSIHLDKRLPAGAGLGGGSSDGAATLRLLRGLFGLPVSDGEMRNLAARLGSDVPFFLLDGPALARGRGERLTAAPNGLSGGAVVVVCPPVAVSTPRAYGWWDSDGAPRTAARAGDCVDALERGDWQGLVAACENAFQPVVLRRVPELGEAFDRLVAVGAEKAVLSGSGSAVFGLFGQWEAARQAADALRSAGATAPEKVFVSGLGGGLGAQARS